MEDNLLVSIAGVLLSLGFAYGPGLKDKYNALDGVRKAQIMFVLLVVSAVGVFLAACYSPWKAVECNEAGAWGLVELLVWAIIANQGTFMIAVEPFKPRKAIPA